MAALPLLTDGDHVDYYSASQSPRLHGRPRLEYLMSSAVERATFGRNERDYLARHQNHTHLPKVLCLVTTETEALEYLIIHRVLPVGQVQIQDVREGPIDFLDELGIAPDIEGIESFCNDSDPDLSFVDAFAALIIPGGDYPNFDNRSGPVNLCYSTNAKNVIKAFYLRNKTIGCIGNAVVALAAALWEIPGVPNLHVNGFPLIGIKDAINEGGWIFSENPNDLCLVFDRVITCRSTARTFELLMKVVGQICNQDRVKDIGWRFMGLWEDQQWNPRSPYGLPANPNVPPEPPDESPDVSPEPSPPGSPIRN